jgi:hypothetical protein
MPHLLLISRGVLLAPIILARVFVLVAIAVRGGVATTIAIVALVALWHVVPVVVVRLLLKNRQHHQY